MSTTISFLLVPAFWFGRYQSFVEREPASFKLCDDTMTFPNGTLALMEQCRWVLKWIIP